MNDPLDSDLNIKTVELKIRPSQVAPGWIARLINPGLAFGAARALVIILR